MAAPRRRPLLGLVAALALALGGTLAPAAAGPADAGLPAWTGGINLYRDGVFTTQKSWLWCTAAGVQIVRNIVEGAADHSASGQRRYFAWMRKHNSYDLPESAGVDPQGWTAGLRHFVDDRYRLIASRSFEDALTSAVTHLRRTNLPVALTVAHGSHGWILTGFSATADPAATTKFRVTSVRVTGPLYGRQSRNGYDMRPNTKLTPAQLERFFTPWKYEPMKMAWDGRWVSIQPVPAKAAAGPAAQKASPGPIALASPSRSPSPGPTAPASRPPRPSPRPSPPDVAVAGPVASPTPPAAADAAAAQADAGPPAGVIAAAVALMVGVLAVRAATGRDRATPRRRT